MQNVRPKRVTNNSFKLKTATRHARKSRVHFIGTKKLTNGFVCGAAKFVQRTHCTFTHNQLCAVFLGRQFTQYSGCNPLNVFVQRKQQLKTNKRFADSGLENRSRGTIRSCLCQNTSPNFR